MKDVKQITPDEGERLLNLAIPCVRALVHLVELKKLKSMEGKTAEYLARQPEAWRMAMEALDAFSNGYEKLFQGAGNGEK